MVAAGIVLYNPDISRLKENINAYVNEVGKIYCFDNGSENITEIEQTLHIYHKAVLIIGGKNFGVAYALNRIMEAAQKDKYEWVLTMDQDSVCQEGMLKKLEEYCNEPKVGIICPYVMEMGGTRDDCKNRSQLEDIEFCITSASLTKVKAWEKVGGYDEWMFIDMVDFEYCAKIIEAGYKILRVNNAFLIQSIGNLREVIVGKRHIYVRNHPAIRRYYWTRNQIYSHKLHPDKFTIIYLSRNYFNEICKIILFENNKRSKLSAMARGISDGVKKIKAL